MNPGHGWILLGEKGERYFSGCLPFSVTGGTSQTLTVPPTLAEAICLPSGLNATLFTQPVWPRSVWTSPLASSQTLTVPSLLPHARRLSSGLNATLFTPPVGSVSTSRGFQVVVSQIF